jgi:ribosomal protein L29
MKSADIKTKTDEELIKGLAEKQVSLNGMKFNIAGSKIKNVREQRATKKDIARFLTELNTRAAAK